MPRNRSEIVLPSIVTVPRVERPGVDRLLDAAAQRPVCVVIGGAGWGKTTAVSGWSRRHRTAWVAAGGRHLRTGGLVREVVEALEPFVPSPLGDLGLPGLGDDERVQDCVVAVARWLGTGLRDDVVLAVDDLQELSSDPVSTRVVDGLCQQLPPRLHVVLISRAEPSFSLERLRGQGLVAEVDASQLAFDAEEVAHLLRATVGEDPPGLAGRLCEQTGGWPTATCRAIELLGGSRAEDQDRVLEQLIRPGGRLRGYLAEQVVGREPPPVRELLRRLAVLGEVEDPAGLAVGVENAESLLTALTRRGVVRLSAGAVDRWSLVPLVQKFVEGELARAPGDAAALHGWAASRCTDRGAHVEALRHLLAAGDHAGCAATLADHGTDLLHGGQVEAVLQVAGQLSSRHLGDPRVQRVLGDARKLREEWARALDCSRRGGEDGGELDPALAWRMALVAYTMGNFGEVLALCERARLAAGDTADESQLLSMAASASRMVGDHARSRALWIRAMTAAERCHDLSALASAYTARAMLAAAEGDRRRTEAYGVTGLNAALAGHDLLQEHRLRVLRALHLLELGQPTAALAETQTALRLGERAGDAQLVAHTVTIRGMANLRLGGLATAVEDLTTACEEFQRIGSRFLAWPLCGLGDAYRTRGQLALARAAYEEAFPLAEPCHEVLGLGAALIGLARVRAADDLTTAADLADRAVRLGEGLREIPALLTRGWVALLRGARAAAASDANRAAAAARARGDRPGLAEALTLTVLASQTPADQPTLLNEAIHIWQETGCRIEEAQAQLVRARLTRPAAADAVEAAEQTLRRHGVSLQSPPAGPLAALACSAPLVSIHALGVFEVRCDGKPIRRSAWQSKKARELVKILVAHRRPVRREQLMELLWPDVPAIKAGNRLSVLLSTLRNALHTATDGTERGPLATDGTTVWLQGVTVDVEDFLSSANAALTNHRTNDDDPTTALIDAEARCTGDFLEDDPYQEWTAPLAEELRTTYLSLLRALLARLRDNGDVDAVERYSLRLLEREPYDEDAHLDLIRTLLAARRFGTARRRYQIYLRRMAEISVDPRPFPAIPAGPPGQHAASPRQRTKPAVPHPTAAPTKALNPSPTPAGLSRRARPR